MQPRHGTPTGDPTPNEAAALEPSTSVRTLDAPPRQTPDDVHAADHEPAAVTPRPAEATLN